MSEGGREATDSDRRRAEGVAAGDARLGDDINAVSVVESAEHPAHHAPIDRADDRMVGGDIAERAMGVDDPETVVAVLGMGGEPVGGERVGYRLNGRAERPMALLERLSVQPDSHGASVLGADLLGQALSLLGGQAVEGASEERQHEVVAAHGELGETVGDGAVSLRRPSSASSVDPGGADLEVAAGREFLEVVSGDVGVNADLVGDRGSGQPDVTSLTHQQVHPASCGIAKGIGDRRHGRGERRGGGHGLSVGGFSPTVVVQTPGVFARMVSMAPTSDQLVEALRPVEDPELHRSIVDLGMLRRAEVSGDGVAHILIALTVAGCPLRNEIQNRVSTAVTALDGVSSVDLEFTVMTDEERAALREMLHGSPGATAGSGHAHGHAEGRAIPFSQPGSKTRPLLISSGKGGVGKSSVTTNLAVALAAKGHSVGVVDADIYGYSIPRMLGTDRKPVVIDEMLVPPEQWGVRCISIGYFVPEGEAVVWRGPMLHKALEQFLTDVYWDEPDFLLIDMPPGTGDIALSLSQYLPRGEVFVVTTPQPAAQKVARLSAAMAEKVNLPVRGVIENMSWFTGDDGKRYEIFGSGGGAELAAELDVPLLGRLPLVPALREGGDDGRPIAAVDPDSEASLAFAEIARAVAEDLRPKKVFSPELRVI